MNAQNDIKNPQALSVRNKAGQRHYVLTSTRHLLRIDLKDIWLYKDLIPLLVKRDFVGEFSQTVLGPVWFVIHPVMQAVVFSLIFGVLAKMPTDGANPFLFYNSGIVLWTYFSMTATFVSNVFITNAGLFGKVYFPRMVVPVSIAIFRSVGLIVNYTLFICFLLFFMWRGADVRPNMWILATPLLIVHTVVLGLGVGLFASAFTTRYRDLVQAFSYLITLWMYASPIIYPLSKVPAGVQWLYYLNPMTSVIETFRYAYLGAGSVNITLWATNAVITLVIFILGVLAFNYTEKTVTDTV